MTGSPPRKLPSLRRELARTLAVGSAVWLLAVFLTVAFGIRHQVDDLMDGALQESAEVLFGLVATRATSLPLASGTAMPAPPHEERLVWQIVDQHDKVLLRSHKAPLTPLLRQFRPGLSDGTGGWRIYAMRLPAEQHLLYVGQPGGDRLESRYEAIAMVGVSGLMVGLACALWMQRRVARAMQPLHDLTAQVQSYDPMGPQPVLPASTRQEFVEIRDAVVDLGGRLARHVQSERAFAAHAAHALRTPLAGMEAQLAMAMKEASDAARPRLKRAREAVVRLKRVITSLLTLFRSQGDLALKEVDLAELLPHLTLESLAVHVTQDCTLRADPDLLAAALANLLDNAVRYGAHACWVDCRCEGSRQYVRVRDDGPGVSPARCQALQEAADRPIDHEFAGLGLKLAALVARTHKGRLLIDGAAPDGRGFSVTMVLWADAPGPSAA